MKEEIIKKEAMRKAAISRFMGVLMMVGLTIIIETIYLAGVEKSIL